VQGVGAVPGLAMGAGTYRGSPFQFFDATLPHHLPLPRPVGPYITVRTTRVVQGAHTCCFIGAFSTEGGEYRRQKWASTCMLASVNPGLAMNAPNNLQTHSYSAMANTAWSFADVTPAAVTVQVMNPNALQTTSGIIYIGRLRTCAMLSQQGTTWDEYLNNFVSYSQPRLCSAAKLSMRGVKVSAIPYNMAEMADFNTRRDISDTTYTWDNSTSEGSLKPCGFAPVCVYNPDAVNLDYLITTEWRVRFDPSNPAMAGAVRHPAATDQFWSRALAALEAAGHGVVDIADTVTTVGSYAYNAYKGVRSILNAGRPALPMLLDG